MENRKGDKRIYIISGFFLVCTVCGGIFLCLYLILPDEQVQSWYPIAGMALVSIPWIFWLLLYLYQCFKPTKKVQNELDHQNQGKFAGTPKSAVTSGGATAVSDVESPLKSPVGGDGARRVHFGPVVVMGNVSDGGDDEQRSPEAATDHHREDSD
ncbi:hypothetical protein L6164_017310 [Bauhinia variegata]|uniref:Uncharacterized protein n=1 Tax=Bauhinia variegata TaxID=167791 RepID=A0ACB9N8A0_BAUVA|nr:hypothetical protein L6164_017310 [Bauhinia variegata]